MVAGIRVVHVVPGLRIADGGPNYSVPRLCRALAAEGAKVDLLTVSEAGPSSDTDGLFSERRFPWDFGRIPLLREIRASSAMRQALRKGTAEWRIFHDHGLWLMPNIYVAHEARRGGRPLIVSPRGMLSPAALSISQLKKRAFWHLLQRAALARAAGFHATSEQEYRDIRAAGFDQPVAIIPNGVDFPEQSQIAMQRIGGPRTILYLGRIHPIKGLETLLKAWGKISASYPDWRLRVLGPGERDYVHLLKSIAATQEIPRVSIESGVYGEEKSHALANASLFVLPSKSENFGVAVAEALASGIPVITTKGTPWNNVVSEGCGWWVDHSVDSIASAMSAALDIPDGNLKAMGQKGRLWTEREFSWIRVARDTVALYLWVAGAADCPAFVRRS